MRPATLSLHPPGEESPQPWTPLTDPQPPRLKPQHYLPRQANICNHKRERKSLLGLHTPRRGCKMQHLGAPFMYLLGCSSIRPLKCHESPPNPTPVLLGKQWNSINLFKDNHGPDNGFFHLPLCRLRSALLYVFQLLPRVKASRLKTLSPLGVYFPFKRLHKGPEKSKCQTY